MKVCVRCRAEVDVQWDDDGERCACPNGCFSETTSFERLEEQTGEDIWWMVPDTDPRTEAEVLAARARETTREEALVAAYGRGDWVAFEQFVQQGIDDRTPPP